MDNTTAAIEQEDSKPRQPQGNHRRVKRWKKLKKKQRKNVILNIITILLLAAGLAWAIHLFWRYQNYEITNDAQVEQFITPINVRVQGYIKTVKFNEHQFVKAGDTLVVIDDSEFQIKLLDAEAALLDAKAVRSTLSSSYKTSLSNIAVAEANTAEVKARLGSLEQDYKRYQNLVKEETVSQQQYEKVKTEYDAAYARYQTLLQQKESATLASAEIVQKTGSADATILRREADLRMAKLNLSYTTITAPYSGYIGRRTIEEGQLVQASQNLANIVRSNQKWITANYKETQTANLYIGQAVNITVDAVKNVVFKGKIVAISEATGAKYSLLPIDNSAGNFVKVRQRIPVRIEFEDTLSMDWAKLRAGMAVEVEAKIRK